MTDEKVWGCGGGEVNLMMNLKNKVFKSPDSFLKNIFKNLSADGIETGDLFLDHICFRVAATEMYEGLKIELLKENELLTESEINGRNIAVFKLKNPINFLGRQIPLLELPAPKSGSFYPKGWEHVEFVINGNLDDFSEKYSHLNFDRKGFSKKLNRDLRRKYDGISVKFHEQSLEDVIRLEKGSSDSNKE